MTDNPLEKLYRNKKVYIALPSKGKFYPSGITLSADGEIGIMPMTATDEIKLKTPDSLFNGEALYELFKSCIPDIVEPREIPACDIDKLLLAIRMATNGPDLDINATCPKCSRGEGYVIQLPNIMNTAQDISEDNEVELDNNVTVTVKPLTLQSQVMSQVETFYQYRMQQMLNDDTMTDNVKNDAFQEALVQAITIQTSQVSGCIDKVVMDDEITVDDKNHIFQWVENMDSPTHEKIKTKIEELSDPKIKNTVTIMCANESCKHEYETLIDLNPVNFF